jgi:hypothetical protein
MAKITEYPSTTRFDSGDVLLKDGTKGTKTITAANAAVEFAGLVSAMNHRNTYRGKNLGTSVTSAQKTAIQNGTFDDLFIGDYWVINGKNWRIADIDYFYNCGDTALTKHHLVIVPDGSLYVAQMNETNTTEGGYVGSKMYTENLKDAKTAFTNAFGDMILTHKEYLTNAVTDGKPSAAGWFDSTVELMNEIMVYGTTIFTPTSDGSTIPTLYTVNKQQLALFQMDITKINQRATFWLRDVVSSLSFAAVSYYGVARSDGASYSLGVRPYAPIG